MKILQVNKFFYSMGGSETYLFAIEKGLRERGHTVAEFAMHHPRNLKSDWSDYFVDPVDYTTSKLTEKIRSAGKIIYSWEARKKISSLLDIFNPDIVHLHIFQHQISPSILPEIARRKIPIVYTSHDLKSICPNYKMRSQGKDCEKCKGHQYYNCLRYKCVKNSRLKSLVNVVEMYFHLYRRYYEQIDLIIAPSKFYQKKLIEFRFQPHKVIHLPNFIDTTEITPSFEHKGYFISLGRLSEEKGILTLIKAMKMLKKGKLKIIGDGPQAEKIKQEIRNHGLTNVEMTGFLSGKALRRNILGSMFSIIPSEWHENCPLSLLESMAMGKSVIGARIGGIPELIEHGENGLLFQSGDPADLAAKIEYLLDHHEKLPVMGRKGRLKMENVYSADRHIDRLLEIYNKAKSKPAPL